MTTLGHLPYLHLVCDGRMADEAEAAGLAEVLIRHRLGQPTLAECTWQDPQSSLLRWAPGHSLVIARDDGTVWFTGSIAEIEDQRGPGPQRTLRVRALDALHDLRRHHAVRSWAGGSLAEIGAEVVQAHGLGWSCPVAMRWPHLVQQGHDDLTFLNLLATAAGASLTLRDRTVQVVPSAGLGQARVLDGDGGEVVVTRRRSPPAVTVAGWDAGRAEAVRSGGGAGLALVDRALADAAQADGLATATHQRLDAISHHITATVPGDVQLLTGSVIACDGHQGVLREVEHRIDTVGGFRTTATTRWDEAEAQPQATGTTLGRVTAVDDPAHAGRVRVSLPACGDRDGGWLPVLAVGAGAGKGLVALPAVGDRVLVQWLDGLRSQGVVLGSLWGAGGPPDAGIAGGDVRRWLLRTASGHHLRLDDQDGSLRIEDAGGSRIDMSRDGVSVTARGGLRLAAPGAGVVISGASIDFRSG